MSVLENDVKPLILEMWKNPIELTKSDQEILAAWAFKMSILFDSLSDAPLIPRGLAYDLRVSRRPSQGVWVTASLFIGPTQLATARLRPLTLAARDKTKPNEPNGLCVTFTAYLVIFQVVILFEDGIFDFEVRQDFQELLTPLWPITEAVQSWPIGGFDDSAAQDLAEWLLHGQ